MFCSSLRKRPQWESVPSTLLSVPTPKWTERTLSTHDIAIPFQRSGEEPHLLRFLLLSASDLDAQKEVVESIERLCVFNDGGHAGIVFLLKEKDMKYGFTAYIQLQTILLNLRLDISIIPLNSLRALPTTLFVYQRQMLRAKTISTPIAPLSVLTYCSSGSQLYEHTKNVLSDMYHGFSELAVAATTTDGQNAIKEYVPDRGQSEEAIRFWLYEYIVE